MSGSGVIDENLNSRASATASHGNLKQMGQSVRVAERRSPSKVGSRANENPKQLSRVSQRSYLGQIPQTTVT